MSTGRSRQSMQCLQQQAEHAGQAEGQVQVSGRIPGCLHSGGCKEERSARSRVLPGRLYTGEPEKHPLIL